MSPVNLLDHFPAVINITNSMEQNPYEKLVGAQLVEEFFTFFGT